MMKGKKTEFRVQLENPHTVSIKKNKHTYIKFTLPFGFSNINIYDIFVVTKAGKNKEEYSFRISSKAFYDFMCLVDYDFACLKNSSHTYSSTSTSRKLLFRRTRNYWYIKRYGASGSVLLDLKLPINLYKKFSKYYFNLPFIVARDVLDKEPLYLIPENPVVLHYATKTGKFKKVKLILLSDGYCHKYFYNPERDIFYIAGQSILGFTIVSFDTFKDYKPVFLPRQKMPVKFKDGFPVKLNVININIIKEMYENVREVFNE